MSPSNVNVALRFCYNFEGCQLGRAKKICSIGSSNSRITNSTRITTAPRLALSTAFSRSHFHRQRLWLHRLSRPARTTTWSSTTTHWPRSGALSGWPTCFRRTSPDTTALARTRQGNNTKDIFAILMLSHPHLDTYIMLSSFLLACHTTGLFTTQVHLIREEGGILFFRYSLIYVYGLTFFYGVT